jgi:hypothetical protein
MRGNGYRLTVDRMLRPYCTGLDIQIAPDFQRTRRDRDRSLVDPRFGSTPNQSQFLFDRVVGLNFGLKY